jgi:hypothetical protein
MKASPKVLVLAAAAAGLAFFLFSKPASAGAVDMTDDEKRRVGGLAGPILAGVKKVFGVISKALFPAAGAAAAAGGATAAIGTTTLVGTNIALPAGAMPGAAASGAGAASGLGPALATAGLLAAPFVLGPPLQKLMTKTHAEWMVQIEEAARADVAYKAASMKMAEAQNLSQRQLSEIPVLSGLAELGGGEEVYS